MWRVTVDHTCVGSGMCTGTAPRHFRLGRDERSQPVEAEIEPDEDVIDAALSCPMEAIVVTDTATGEVLVPDR
jgi:ferredoxin